MIGPTTDTMTSHWGLELGTHIDLAAQQELCPPGTMNANSLYASTITTAVAMIGLTTDTMAMSPYDCL